MRSSFLRVTTTVIVGLLVAACAPAASPAPITTPPPSVPPTTPATSATLTALPTTAPIATPEPSRAPTGWPYTVLGDSQPVFGPDGTIYILARDGQGEYQRIAIALDAAGHVKPGWPVEAPGGSFFGSLAVGPDGSAYINECGGPEIGCAVHRLGVDGRDLPGWPYKVPVDFACPAIDQCYLSILDIEPSGGAYLTSGSPDGLGVIAIDARGDTMPGWPIVLDDYDWSDPQLGPEGTLFVIRRPIGTPTWDPSRGRIDENAELWAFGSNGKPRSGWPVPAPDIGRYLIGPQGDVVVWSLMNDIGELCSHPRRTVFTVLGPDGRTWPGWPRGSTGFASFPALGDDGTLYYVSATHKVYAHDRTGEIKNGWPVPVPGAADACGSRSPYVAPDGTIHVVGEEVSALTPDGRALAGWPYGPVATADAPCFDSECYGGPTATAIAPDGTVYVVVYQTESTGVRAEVVALDRQARLKPGWPYRVPFDANTVSVGASVSPDGRLIIRGGDQLLALDPDGRISD